MDRIPQNRSFKNLGQASLKVAQNSDKSVYPELDILWRAGLNQTVLKQYAGKGGFPRGSPQVWKIVCQARQDLIHNCFTNREHGAPKASKAYTDWQQRRGEKLCIEQIHFLCDILALKFEDVKTLKRRIEDKRLPKLNLNTSTIKDPVDRVFFLRVMADTWRYYGKDLGLKDELGKDWWQNANFFYCAARYYLGVRKREVPKLPLPGSVPSTPREKTDSEVVWDFVRYTPDDNINSLFEPGMGAEFAGLMLNYITLLESVAESWLDTLKQEKQEISKEKQEISKEEEEISKEKQEISKEKREISKEKQEISKEEEEISSRAHQALDEGELTEDQRQQSLEERQRSLKTRQLLDANPEILKEREQIVQEKQEILKQREQILKERRAIFKEREPQIRQETQEIMSERRRIAKDATTLIMQHLDKVPEEDYKTIRLLFLALKSTLTTHVTPP